jgi:hypothetical protein
MRLETIKSRLGRIVGPLAWKRAACLFVLSTGRTGTALLTRLLSMSPQVDSFHEPAPNPRDYYASSFSHCCQEPARFARILRDLRGSRIGVSRLRGRIYSETSNRLTFFAPAICVALPRAKWIHLHRHPGGVIRSGMRSGWYDGHKFDMYKIVPGEEDPHYKMWRTWDAFAKTCWFWNAANEYALRFSEEVGTERVLSVSYGELIRSDANAARRIFDFLGVPTPSDGAIQQTLSIRVNHKSDGYFPPYSEWTEQHRATLVSITGETMGKLGYSTEEST